MCSVSNKKVKFLIYLKLQKKNRKKNSLLAHPPPPPTPPNTHTHTPIIEKYYWFLCPGSTVEGTSKKKLIWAHWKYDRKGMLPWLANHYKANRVKLISTLTESLSSCSLEAYKRPCHMELIWRHITMSVTASMACSLFQDIFVAELFFNLWRRQLINSLTTSDENS